MTQLRIPAVYMRGGTSKGVFLRPEDRLSDPAAREEGGQWVVSKALMSRSARRLMEGWVRAPYV